MPIIEQTIRDNTPAPLFQESFAKTSTYQKRVHTSDSKFQSPNVGDKLYQKGIQSKENKK